jgi:hypothetical protein
MAKSADEIRAEMRARKPETTIPKVAPERNGAPPPTAQSRQIVPRRTRYERINQDMPSNRELPHAPEVESGILGCIIRSPAFCVPIITQRVGAAHFYSPANQTIFTDLVNFTQDNGLKGNEGMDLAVLEQYFRDIGHLEKIGGSIILRSLFVDAANPEMLSYYLDTLVAKHQRRELFISQSSIANRSLDESEELTDLLALAQANVERVLALSFPSARLPELRDLSQMLGESKPARPPELVKSVLHQGSKLIVGGTSKGRKTYSLIDLAISVATGHSWWGFDCAKGPVCYINFEIQESFFCERVETICDKKGVNLDPKMLMGWNLRGHGEGIERLVEELMVVLRKKQFVLIVFDPIYKALGDRDENKAGDVASMLNELERIAVRTGAAIAFGAHYSKGNQSAKEAIDRIGGSGVFARDPDSILTMTAHEEEDAFTVEATLRNFRPLDPFVVKWDWPLFQRSVDLDPENLKRPRSATGQLEPKHSDKLLLDELSIIDGSRPSSLVRKMSEFHGMSRATFYRLARKLKDSGELTERDGLWFKGGKKS